MSTTTTVVTEAPRYEYYYRDNHRENKREVLLGDRAVETFNEIPVVDVSRIFSENIEDRQAVANEIAEVCKKVGFMYIKGHGVSQELMNEVFDLSRRYHAQPSEVKMQEYVYKNQELRGFDQHFAKTPDGPVLMKGSFLYSYDPDTDPVPPKLTPEQRAMCLGTYNQWPANPPEFKEKMLKYQRELIKLSRKLLHSFALGLGAEETYFDNFVTAPFVSIILQHYLPTHPNAEEPDSLGAHTDFETFTILNQDPVGGLEILNKNGIYIPAPYIPGTFIVNIGDFLERVSNDRFVSTVHRVRNATGRERYSIPFFFGFNMDASVGVLPSCTSPENPAKYPARNLYDYTAGRRKKQRASHQSPGLDNPLA
ncbi:Oxoglutarate/iron-dependent oxygenase [Pleurostoma richardsiae]|uniref:Oxoglutarate/iron-dependent oxygenase n=1 Tax=Pleurostoma richardsiae TaxID=41990 RepID=A0AA38RNA3_9PEZI|nr:Oxoglutarate/iron-dependent oxygenase [Pleurostoma richardsiae]